MFSSVDVIGDCIYVSVSRSESKDSHSYIVCSAYLIFELSWIFALARIIWLVISLPSQRINGFGNRWLDKGEIRSQPSWGRVRTLFQLLEKIHRYMCFGAGYCVFWCLSICSNQQGRWTQMCSDYPGSRSAFVDPVWVHYEFEGFNRWLFLLKSENQIRFVEMSLVPTFQLLMMLLFQGHWIERKEWPRRNNSPNDFWIDGIPVNTLEDNPYNRFPDFFAVEVDGRAKLLVQPFGCGDRAFFLVVD